MTDYDEVIKEIRSTIKSFGFDMTDEQCDKLKKSLCSSMSDYYMEGYSEGQKDYSERDC